MAMSAIIPNPTAIEEMLVHRTAGRAVVRQVDERVVGSSYQHHTSRTTSPPAHRADQPQWLPLRSPPQR